MSSTTLTRICPLCTSPTVIAQSTYTGEWSIECTNPNCDHTEDAPVWAVNAEKIIKERTLKKVTVQTTVEEKTP